MYVYLTQKLFFLASYFTREFYHFIVTKSHKHIRLNSGVLSILQNSLHQYTYVFSRKTFYFFLANNVQETRQITGRESTISLEES